MFTHYFFCFRCTLLKNNITSSPIFIYEGGKPRLDSRYDYFIGKKGVEVYFGKVR